MRVEGRQRQVFGLGLGLYSLLYFLLSPGIEKCWHSMVQKGSVPGASSSTSSCLLPGGVQVGFQILCTCFYWDYLCFLFPTSRYLVFCNSLQFFVIYSAVSWPLPCPFRQTFLASLLTVVTFGCYVTGACLSEFQRAREL